MLAVSIIVLSVNCGHYSLFSDCPIPSLLLLLLLVQLRTENVADCCAVAVLTWFSEIATSLRQPPPPSLMHSHECLLTTVFLFQLCLQVGECPTLALRPTSRCP